MTSVTQTTYTTYMDFYRFFCLERSTPTWGQCLFGWYRFHSWRFLPRWWRVWERWRPGRGYSQRNLRPRGRLQRATWLQRKRGETKPFFVRDCSDVTFYQEGASLRHLKTRRSCSRPLFLWAFKIDELFPYLRFKHSDLCTKIHFINIGGVHCENPFLEKHHDNQK